MLGPLADFGGAAAFGRDEPLVAQRIQRAAYRHLAHPVLAADAAFGLQRGTRWVVAGLDLCSKEVGQLRVARRRRPAIDADVKDSRS